MKTAHTPAPWRVREVSIWARQIVAGNGRIVATCEQSLVDGENEGERIGLSGRQIAENARLIAAAPELLAALKALVTPYEALRDGGSINAAATAKDFEAAIVAIAKTKGEAE